MLSDVLPYSVFLFRKPVDSSSSSSKFIRLFTPEFSSESSPARIDFVCISFIYASSLLNLMLNSVNRLLRVEVYGEGLIDLSDISSEVTMERPSSTIPLILII